MKKPLIIIAGPTACGKTSMSIRLAKEIDGEIISADSMQVYKRMDIGTAKIKVDEMQGIKHYLIDVLEPDQEFNIVRFQQLAKAAISEIYNKNKIPILVGGTGFYIQSVLNDIDFNNSAVDIKLRKELEKLLAEKGPAYLYDILKSIDPESSENIHMNNTKRVIRAIEYYKSTGNKISEHNTIEQQRTSPYAFKYYVLNMERQRLYARIDRRVDKMMNQGLLEEVKALKESGLTSDMISMQGIGYKEIMGYLNKEYTLDEAVDIIKRETRRFAKRQITWFKRETDAQWFEIEDYNDDRNIICNIMKKEFIEMMNEETGNELK